MGFSFRKSIKIAPGIRLNVSKSGIGVSGGVKGARVSLGPRGAHVYGGIGPLRYQKKLDARSRSSGSFVGTENSATSQIEDDPFYLKRPRNWHAWIAFLLMGMPLSWVAPLHIDALTNVAGFVGIGGWIYVLCTGPKRLKAYRRFRKANLSTMPLPEKVSFLESCYRDYPNTLFMSLYAQALGDSKQFKEALPLLQELAVKFPQAIFYAALGECFRGLERYDEALRYFEMCDEEHEFDNFMTVLKLKAQCYIAKREYDKALETVDRGLRRRGEQHSDNKRALRLLKAETYLQINQLDRAKNEVEKLLSEVPDLQEGKELLEKINSKAS